MPKQGQNTTNIEIPEEEDLLDDQYQESYIDPDGEPDYTQQGEQVKSLSSKVQLNRKGMTIAIIVVAVLIAVVLFTGKLPLPKLGFLGGGGDGNSSGGTASGLLESYDEAAEGSTEEGTEDDVTSLIIRDLQGYYPGYDIVRNEELQQIEATGTTEDGQLHKMILDYNGDVIEETIGNSEVNEEGEVIAQQPTESEGSPDTVQVPLSEYNKYQISKKQQAFVEETETEGEESYSPSVTTTEERLIIEYERLPIKGTTPMVYSKVIETGEEIIFAVTLRQYANLGAKGTTVIQVTRSEGYGVKTIDQVTLVKWQD